MKRSDIPRVSQIFKELNQLANAVERVSAGDNALLIVSNDKDNDVCFRLSKQEALDIIGRDKRNLNAELLSLTPSNYTEDWLREVEILDRRLTNTQDAIVDVDKDGWDSMELQLRKGIKQYGLAVSKTDAAPILMEYELRLRRKMADMGVTLD